MHVIKKLAKNHGLVVKNLKEVPNEQTPLEKKIIEFYNRDDISHVLPGRKDVMNVTVNGEKVAMPKRYLSMTLGETHALFKIEFSDQFPVERSKFFSMRPDNVKRMDEKDQTVCACPICENMNFMFEAAGVKLTDELVDSIDTDKDDFMGPFLAPDRDFALKKWTKGIIETDVIPFAEFKNSMEQKLRAYKEHINLKKQQSRALINQRQSLRPGEVLIQTDFAENYNIQYSVEVMEKHWTSVPGVVILTAVAYFQDENGAIAHKSFAICSDVKNNTTLEMVFLLDGVIVELRNCGIHFEKGVILWTDGATKHFKNRFAMCYLSRFEGLYGAPATWNFTESYHGKGPMDGIGAVVKHGVFMACLRENLFVQNAKEFAECAKKRCPNISVLYRSAEALEERKEEFINLWQGARDCSGILKARCVRVSGPYKVSLFKTSQDLAAFGARNLEPSQSATTSQSQSEVPMDTPDLLMTCDASEDPQSLPVTESEREDGSALSSDYDPGSFVLVEFSFLSTERYYVACIVARYDSQNVNVKYLSRDEKGFFRYPDREDWDTIDVKSIVKRLPYPSCNSRGDHYYFEGEEFPKATQ